MNSKLAFIAVATASSSAFLLILYLRRKKSSLSSLKFGSEIREAEFLFDENVVPCNHGSYGTVPRRVLAAKQQFEVDTERGPDIFVQVDHPKHYEASKQVVAQFIGSDKENFVFVKNATTAVNCVLNSVKFDEGDAILLTNLTYPSMAYTADVISQLHGVDVVTLELHFPINSKYEIIQKYKEILSANPAIKLTIIDHITSSTAVLMPVKELIELCHQYNVRVLIDGAHAPGQVPLNLEQLGADYYTGNLHKWVYTPRGCAFLWVDPKHQGVVKPLVTSHNYNKDFQKQFYMQGTTDDSSYLSAVSAVQFYQDIGGMEKISEYNTALLDWSLRTLSEEWKSEILSVPQHLRAPFMGLVALPHTNKKYEIVMEWANSLKEELLAKHNIICAPVQVDGRLWCRLSINVYSTKQDIWKLCQGILDIMSDD